MARLARLAVPGRTHYIVQRGQAGRAVFVDADDRLTYLAALRDAAISHRVAIHAYALSAVEVQLLATPADVAGLSLAMQAVGRRYVSAYNRKHACTGTLWDGRFRAAVVEPGAWTLAALTLVDAAVEASTSAGHRTGARREALLVDPPELWQLGNTPFDREGAYQRLLVLGVSGHQQSALRTAALGNWAIGSAAFLQSIRAEDQRPLRPRAGGRPSGRAAAAPR